MSLLIKRLESNALRELSILLTRDSRNQYLKEATITEVRITNDLSYMTIYYTSYIKKDKGAVADALEESKSYLRRELAKTLNARKMPELIFKYDEALEYGNHMNEVLSKLNIKHDEDENNSEE